MSLKIDYRADPFDLSSITGDTAFVILMPDIYRAFRIISLLWKDNSHVSVVILAPEAGEVETLSSVGLGEVFNFIIDNYAGLNLFVLCAERAVIAYCSPRDGVCALISEKELMPRYVERRIERLFARRVALGAIGFGDAGRLYGEALLSAVRHNRPADV